jgi:hypothetical protein
MLCVGLLTGGNENLMSSLCFSVDCRTAHSEAMNEKRTERGAKRNGKSAQSAKRSLQQIELARSNMDDGVGTPLCVESR